MQVDNTTVDKLTPVQQLPHLLVRQASCSTSYYTVWSTTPLLCIPQVVNRMSTTSYYKQYKIQRVHCKHTYNICVQYARRTSWFWLPLHVARHLRMQTTTERERQTKWPRKTAHTQKKIIIICRKDSGWGNSDARVGARSVYLLAGWLFTGWLFIEYKASLDFRLLTPKAVFLEAVRVFLESRQKCRWHCCTGGER